MAVVVVVVSAGGGERGDGFVPGERPRVVVRGQAQGAGALHLVLQAPAEERRLLHDLAVLGGLVFVVVGQANHGVGLGQVSTEGGALGRLCRHGKCF